MKRTAAQGIVVAIFVLSVTACTSGTSRTDGGGDADVDAAHDVGFLCAVTTNYPQYDDRCVKNVGCSDLQPIGCGCQCGRCRNTQCVLEVCPICPNDGGTDSGDAADGPRDGGYTDAGCLDPLDLDGSHLDANWAAVKVFVAKVSEDDINDKFFAWTVPDGMGSKNVIYLVFETKTVFKVPNCSHINLLSGVTVCGDWAYWVNYVTYVGGTGPSELFGFQISPQGGLPTVKTNLGIADVLFCNGSGDVLVRYLDKQYHAKFNYYPAGEFNTSKTITLYNADKAAYIRLIDTTVVFTLPNPSDEILNTCMRSHDLASGKETVKICGDGTYITDSHGNRVAYQDWRNSGEFGYGESDIYVYDFDTDQDIEITHDEFSQWCPVIHGDLVVYQDLTEFGGYEGGPGYLWVYDLATKVRRKIPTEPMDGCPTGMNARYVSFRQGFSPVANNVYLVDMEKAGVVKDGHVVPEGGDGGSGDQ